MPDTEMVVMVAITAALILAFIALLRLVATIIMHRTIRKAVETNPQLAEGLLDKLTQRPERPGDERLGMILVAIGVAMGVAPLIAIDDPGMVRVALAAALFPLLVGGTLWLRSRAVERAQRRDRGE